MDDDTEIFFTSDTHKLYRMADYTILNKLGSGTYGQVYLAKNKKDKHLYAIKKIKIDEGIPKHALREIGLLKVLQHPNIITLYQVILTYNKCYMITEYMKVSLYTFVRNYTYEKELIHSFMFQLLQATLFCHNRGVIHRDIKSHNILVHHTMKVVKLIDFGLARKIDCSMLPLTPGVVTLFYRSPELLLKSRDYSSGVDIWSLGCVFAEMLLKEVPFRGTGENGELDILFNIFYQLGLPAKDDFPEISNKVEIKFPEHTGKSAIKLLKEIADEKCFNLIMKMFIYDSFKRITAHEAITDVFFQDFDRTQVPAIKEEDFGRLTVYDDKE